LRPGARRLLPLFRFCPPFLLRATMLFAAKVLTGPGKILTPQFSELFLTND
jgi:hypothetical protein